MSIVNSASIIAYLGASSYSTDIQAIHEGVEATVKKLSGQPWESTTYTNKAYDGTGGISLWLNEVPIISVKYAIINPYEVVKVKNTMTDSSLATVVVDATNVTLTVEGGSGNGSDTLAKGTYTTMTLLVDAINAQSANGWSALIYDTDYNALKTSYLFDQQIDCTQEGGVAKDYEYLQVGEFAQNIKVNKATGQIYSESGFPRGFQNIFITYTAGYATIPADITYFILDSVKALYARKTSNAEGNVVHYRIDNLEYWYGEIKESRVSIPESILGINTNVRI